MSLKLTILFCLYTFSIDHSIHLITTLYRKPDYARILYKICYRESRCTRKGIHKIDHIYSPRVWKKAVRRNILRPASCPFHRDPWEWSTSGPFGLMRGYHWGYLNAPCLPAWILDIPLVATWVAFQKLVQHCAHYCTYKTSRIYWKGKQHASNSTNQL